MSETIEMSQHDLECLMAAIIYACWTKPEERPNPEEAVAESRRICASVEGLKWKP